MTMQEDSDGCICTMPVRDARQRTHCHVCGRRITDANKPYSERPKPKALPEDTVAALIAMLRAERDGLQKDIMRVADERDEARAELRMIDATLARRPALADCKSRGEAIEKTITVAARAEAAELRVEAMADVLITIAQFAVGQGDAGEIIASRARAALARAGIRDEADVKGD